MPNQKFQLKVVSGYESQAVQSFDQDVVAIGRGVDSDLRLETGIVSRQHAELRRSSGSFVLAAQSKTNPVSVDEVVVTPGQSAPLRDGSRLVLSNKIVIEFSFASESVTPPAAPTPAAPPATGGDTPSNKFSRELLGRVRSSLSDRLEGGQTPPSTRLTRPTIPISRAKVKDTLDAPEPKASEPTQPRPTGDSRAPTKLLTKLFAKPPEVVDLASSSRAQQGEPGAAIKVEGLTGRTRVEVYDDLLIGAGPDSDVVIQGAYAPRRAAVAVRVGDRYRLYNVSPSPQTVRLNGRAIEGQAALQDGDELEVYGVMLQVAIPPR